MKIRTSLPVRLSALGMLLLGMGVVSLFLWRSAKPARADTPQDMDWRFYGNDPANNRFQNVYQVNPSNVGTLKPAWVFYTKNQNASNHANTNRRTTLTFNNMASIAMSPIVVHVTMFVTDADDVVCA